MAASASSSPGSTTGLSGRLPKSSTRWQSEDHPGRRSMPTRPIPWVEQRTKLALADSQREAVRVALVSKVLVITGGPGVGKTTLVNSILKILLAKTIAISLCAPTGRAAKRLSESTGIEAKTIHRLLETDPRTGSFRRSEGGAARLRSAGRRRDLDGRRAADARSPTGPAGVRGAAAGWRCRSAAIGRTGASSGRH